MENKQTKTFNAGRDQAGVNSATRMYGGASIYDIGL